LAPPQVWLRGTDGQVWLRGTDATPAWSGFARKLSLQSGPPATPELAGLEEGLLGVIVGSGCAGEH